jgi:hypothetical protein
METLGKLIAFFLVIGGYAIWGGLIISGLIIAYAICVLCQIVKREIPPSPKTFLNL